ncbi:serine/threonine-protein kinase, active site protein [Artemisia annua]|uniref:Serine/threonine-protein kinase, active site protein n=1 Tax=Artemisia annua TaxID=35608 RepID=A0A2U1MRH4_ARTAN|nr:serine/threonine-protein kinase, active site protein [Artemisia annua]
MIANRYRNQEEERTIENVGVGAVAIGIIGLGFFYIEEDHEIWEPKLPRDYQEILESSKIKKDHEIWEPRDKVEEDDEEIEVRMYSQKRLYELLCKGVLLKNGNTFFSLGSNGGKSELISAINFSFKNSGLHKWRSTQDSRFTKVAKIYTISNLKINIKIRTQFLSAGVNYGVHLVFKFCGPRKSSNMVQVQQLTTDSEEISKRSASDDEGEKALSLNEVNENKHLMLSAKEVLYDSSKVKCVKLFHLKPSEDPRFQEVIELLPRQVFSLKCKIQSQMSLLDTDYMCYLVFKLSEKCHGLHCPVKVKDVLHWKNKEMGILYFRTPSPWNIHDNHWVPKKREDGWLEVSVWKFNSTSDLRKDNIPMHLKLIAYEGTMSGLIVGGLEIRPV